MKKKNSTRRCLFFNNEKIYNFIENNYKNRNINTNYNNCQKLNFKIKGDIDNWEKDNNDFDNNELKKILVWNKFKK